MKIIACGNPYRRDDAAGLLVAERLQAFGIDVEVCSGETTDLMTVWEDADSVILIDAVMTGAPPGTIHVWDSSVPGLVSDALPSTHGLGVAEAFRLVQVLGRAPACIRVYGIEAAGFELGASPSAPVTAAADQLAARIAGEIGARPCA